MRFLITIFFITTAFTSLLAQRNQIQIVSENDSYTSINNDGYYTNGFKIAYKWRKKNADTIVLSRTNQLEIGQHIYNARHGLLWALSSMDRPITGYLYGSFQQTNFNKKQDVLRWEISAGTIGKPAFGEEVQNLIHKIVNVSKVTQWKYQLRPGFGINASAIWSPQVVKNSDLKKFDIKPIASATLGNIFTNATIGSAVLLGKFNENIRSNFWDNHYGDSKNQKEFFFYFYPAIHVQAYNATVQGSMFNDQTEIIEGKLNPVLFHGRAGIVYARPKYSLSYVGAYEGKQSLAQKKGQLYGSIQLAFRW